MEEDQQQDLHAAVDHPMHTMSNHCAHDAPKEHVMPASGEMTAPFILLVQGRV